MVPGAVCGGPCGAQATAGDLLCLREGGCVCVRNSTNTGACRFPWSCGVMGTRVPDVAWI